MSGLSPSRGLRSKTSEFAGLFRSSHSGAHAHAQQTPRPPETSSAHKPAALQPPADGASSTPSESGLKRVTTKIPFLGGRTRKKSTHSNSGTDTSAPGGRGYVSAEIDTAAAKKSRRLSHPVSSTTPPTSHPPPVPAIIPPAVPSASFGSKLTAHFSHHVKPRKNDAYPRNSQTLSSEGNASYSLSPPTSPRDASIDSGSSSNRSPTPRANQPTITVSLPPDNLDDYKDLFTLPRNKIVPKRLISTPASEYRDRYQANDSNVTLSPKSQPSPMAKSLFPAHIRRAGAPSSDTDDGDIRTSDDTPPILRHPIKRRPTPDKKADDDSTGDSGKSRNLLPNEFASDSELASSTATLQKRQANLSASPLHRSRLRMPSAASSQPPTIPLPPPPSDPPASPVTCLPHRSTSLSPQIPVPRRPRAHTIGAAVPSAQLAIAPASPPSPSTARIPPRGDKAAGENENAPSSVKQSSSQQDFDVNMASADQLRKALIARNKQFDDLASYLLKITGTHAAEKSALEKKVSALEKELAKKDKEIQGFLWMLGRNGGSSPRSSSVAVRSTSTPLRRSDTPDSGKAAPSSHRTPQQIHHYPDDSGVESSYATSGAESIRGSGTSGAESFSSMRVRKLRTPVNDPQAYNLHRSSSTSKRSGNNLAVDGAASSDPSSGSTRSSLYSVASTSSSASSVPSSTTMSSVSSLSAIPEAPSLPSSPSKSPQTQVPLADREHEEKRSNASTRRISSSSVPSHSPVAAVATTAYAANLRKGRPPSIAQVLEKSQPGGDIVEKLLPVASPVPTAI